MSTKRSKILKPLFSDFHVSSEEELTKKLLLESNTIPCIICRKEFPVDCLTFIDGNPFCSNCK